MANEHEMNGEPMRKALKEQAPWEQVIPRSRLGLEWADSEWFEVWLQLARENQKSDQN